MDREDKKRKGLSASFVTGAVALVFLIVGYQVALFLNRTAISKILADRSSPDTVYIAYNPEGNGQAVKEQEAPRTGDVVEGCPEIQDRPKYRRKDKTCQKETG